MVTTPPIVAGLGPEMITFTWFGLAWITSLSILVEKFVLPARLPPAAGFPL